MQTSGEPPISSPMANIPAALLGDPLTHHSHSSLLNGLRNECMTIACHSAHGHKQTHGSHLAGIHCDVFHCNMSGA